MPASEHIIQLLNYYGYLVLFPIAVIEGPIISIISGFLISKHILAFIPVYFILLGGDITGDVLYYSLGRWGTRFLLRWGHKIGLSRERIARVDRHFIKHGGKTLLFWKLTQTAGPPIFIPPRNLPIPF